MQPLANPCSLLVSNQHQFRNMSPFITISLGLEFGLSGLCYTLIIIVLLIHILG